MERGNQPATWKNNAAVINFDDGAVSSSMSTARDADPPADRAAGNTMGCVGSGAVHVVRRGRPCGIAVACTITPQS